MAIAIAKNSAKNGAQMSDKKPRLASVVAMLWRNLRRDLTDPYRPELHYMRGPGPKWHAKHAVRSLDDTHDFADSAAIAA